MADLIQQANQYFEERRHEILSLETTYDRDGFSVSYFATLGKSIFIEVNSEDVETNVVYIDFVFRKDDIFNVFDVPKVGDTVTYESNGQTLVYEVQKPLGEQAYSVDAYNLSITIHTQLLRRETC